MKTTYINRKLLLFLSISVLSFSALSCKKQDDWLNVKNKKSSVTPQTLSDFQAVLDNAQVMNFSCPVIGELSADNVYFTDASISALAAPDRNAYLWQKDIFQGTASGDWNYPYQEIEYANIVLDGLAAIGQPEPGNANASGIKGAALFFRAFAYYNLSQLFCSAYHPNSAGSDPGLPLRLTSDVNEKSKRATVRVVFEQMISDLNSAEQLLPQTPLYKTRPSAVAAQFLQAKVYLAMQNYPMALKYADLVMAAGFHLIDFKSLNVTASQPFPSFAAGNPEVVFYASATGNSAVWPLSSTGRVDPALFATYQSSDLRKTAFYSLDSKSGFYRFKGSYEGSDFYNFSGLAVNEALLIRSEARNRTGDIAGALDDLNALLKSRSDNTFEPLDIKDGSQLLAAILLERRKELPFTANIRWEDLRRINQQPATAVTITRSYAGNTYQLLPNSPLYTFPIPQNEIDASGIVQNER